MLKRVTLRLVSLHHTVGGSLFEGGGRLTAEASDPPARMEMTTRARYLDNGERVSISYEESELTGMQGSTATVSFSKGEPGVISMLRNGSVKTSLLFEAGKQHDCVYQTPIMPFDVRLLTHEVENRLEQDGTLRLCYTLQLRGAEPERTELVLTMLSGCDVP